MFLSQGEGDNVGSLRLPILIPCVEGKQKSHQGNLLHLDLELVTYFLYLGCLNNTLEIYVNREYLLLGSFGHVSRTRGMSHGLHV